MEDSLGSSPPPSEAGRGAILRFVMQQPGVVISGVYLVSSAIGMLDSWWYYRRFGINVFLYSDLADFLLASFRSPTAWLIVVYTAVIAVWEYAASLRRGRSRSERRGLRWLGSPAYRQASLVLAIAFVVGYIVFYAGLRADAILGGRGGEEVRVTLANSASNGEMKAVLLGSTLHFVFLLDRSAGAVSVHPYENVLAIESAVPRLPARQSARAE